MFFGQTSAASSAPSWRRRQRLRSATATARLALSCPTMYSSRRLVISRGVRSLAKSVMWGRTSYGSRPSVDPPVCADCRPGRRAAGVPGSSRRLRVPDPRSEDCRALPPSLSHEGQRRRSAAGGHRERRGSNTRRASWPGDRRCRSSRAACTGEAESYGENRSIAAGRVVLAAVVNQALLAGRSSGPLASSMSRIADLCVDVRMRARSNTSTQFESLPLRQRGLPHAADATSVTVDYRVPRALQGKLPRGQNRGLLRASACDVHAPVLIAVSHRRA